MLETKLTVSRGTSHLLFIRYRKFSMNRDVKKCKCFWVPSYDLFASARKAVFPAPTATGVHRLRNTWSSL